MHVTRLVGADSWEDGSEYKVPADYSPGIPHWWCEFHSSWA